MKIKKSESILRQYMGMEGLILLACIAIFFKDFFIMRIGVHAEVLGILILTFTALFSLKERRGTMFLAYWHSLYVLVIAIVAIISSLNSGVANVSSYFASFVVASLVVITRPKYFLRSMTILMSINLIVQLIEVMSGQFLFVYVDTEYEYDEKMLGVGDGSFRAKGFFGSPLNAISVSMSLAFLNPRSIYNWTILIFSSSLGQGRLGLFVGFFGLVISLINKEGSSSKRKLQRIFVGFLVIAVAIFLSVFFGSAESIDRLLSAGSSENSQNLNRLLVWNVALNELLKYDFLSIIFGRYGYIKSVIGGAESDWFRLWLDNGFIFLLFYFISLVGGLWRSMRRKFWPEMFAYFLLIFVMSVYPHAQSMPNGTLTWLTIFVTLYGYRSVIDSKLVSVAMPDRHLGLENYQLHKKVA